jgi:DNA-binding beta-propeller fold protein YncE
MRHIRIVAIGAATLALLAACTASPPALPEQALTWPGPPDPAKVTFVRAFSRADDLGIRRTLLQRLGDLVYGSRDERLVRPMAVVDVGGALYVADPGMRAIHRFDRTGGRHDLLYAEGERALPSPVGLARGASGEVYVTDSALRKVFVILPGARAAAELQLDTELRQPTGVAFDAKGGRLYVADTAAHVVRVFGRDGRLLQTIGQRGVGDGQFNFPTLLWRDAGSGRLYVTDSLNFRVQVFNQAGGFESKFGRHGDGSGDMARHKGVATDRHGHVYVVDALFHALQIFDGSGRLLLGLGGQGRERGEFWLPAGVFVGDDDLIYVADSYNQRVQVFRYIGGAS